MGGVSPQMSQQALNAMNALGAGSGGVASDSRPSPYQMVNGRAISPYAPQFRNYLPPATLAPALTNS